MCHGLKQITCNGEISFCMRTKGVLALQEVLIKITRAHYERSRRVASFVQEKSDNNNSRSTRNTMDDNKEKA